MAMTSRACSAMPRTGLTVGLAYAAFVSMGLSDGFLGIAWPSIRTTFGLPLAALGALSTSIMIGALATSFSSGRLMAQLGAGWLLAAGCLFLAVSLLAYGLAPLWSVMVLYGLAAGIGSGAITAGLNIYAAKQFRPRTMNWLHASYGLGAAVGPLMMSGILSAGLSWRLGYLLSSLGVVVLAGCFAITRGEWLTENRNGQTLSTASAPLRHTLVLSTAWLCVLLCVLFSGVDLAGQWLYTLLTEARGMAPAVAGMWVSMYWGSQTIGRIVSGAIIERLTIQRLLRLSMAGALVGIVLLWLDRSPWLALAGVILLGVSLAPMFPSFLALTPTYVGPLHAANTIGLQLTIGRLGTAAFVSGFGLLASRIGLEAFGPTLLGTAMLLTVVFLRLERRPRAGQGSIS